MPQQGGRPPRRRARRPPDDREARRRGHDRLSAAPRSRDVRTILVARAVRGALDGIVAIVLAAHLTALGWSATEIGLLVTGMLLGSAAVTLGVGLAGHRVARRTVLTAAAVTMVVTGAVWASTTAAVALAVVGVIGTMNPSSGDVSVFLPMEQSLVASLVDDARRTSTFATYAFVGSAAAAAGSLAAGLPERLAAATSLDAVDSYRVVFALYAAGGVAVLVAYRSLSSVADLDVDAPATSLGPSRRTVVRLAALFSLDAFGGGFVVQSLLALWLFQRFDLSLAAAGALLSWTGICSAVSLFAAPRLAARIGLVRTMVFTHLPAQVLLVAAAFAPSLAVAVVCLVARSLLATMDVPARTSYVMAVVTPAERAAAATVTNVPRSLAAALPPLAAGWMLDRSDVGWPLVVAGVLKATYDLLLLRAFRDVHPPEELATASTPS